MEELEAERGKFTRGRYRCRGGRARRRLWSQPRILSAGSRQTSTHRSQSHIRSYHWSTWVIAPWLARERPWLTRRLRAQSTVRMSSSRPRASFSSWRNACRTETRCQWIRCLFRSPQTKKSSPLSATSSWRKLFMSKPFQRRSSR